MVVGEEVFANRVRYQRLVENVNNVVRNPAQCDESSYQPETFSRQTTDVSDKESM